MENFTYKEKDIMELDYSTKDSQILMKEFSILINSISTNYENKLMESEKLYKKQIDELNNLLKFYESSNKNIVTTIFGKIYKIKKQTKSNFKKIKTYLISKTFIIVKRIVIRFGIKDKVKNTKLFKKMNKKGIVDEMAGRKK